MKNLEVILASASPRRKELMEIIGFPFRIEVSEVDETMNGVDTLENQIQELAYRKVVAVAQRNENAIVIGADTIVVLEDEILGKPIDEDDACRMLKKLSGNTHRVLTGVCIQHQSEKMTFCSVSEVTFNHLTDEEIWQYIKTKEPMDKAGSYGIQGFGGCFVKEIRGDYYTIVGLPLSRVYTELKKFFS